MEEQHWEDEILNSLEGLQRAEPSPHLYGKIKATIADGFTASRMQVVRRPYIALAAACLALLITANISLLAYRSMEASTTSAYAVDNANFSLYP